MNSYNLLKVQDILNSVHPKQIISSGVNIKFTMFEVKYEYITNRNNKKVSCKYFLSDSLNPNANMEEKLNEYIEEYNLENTHRQISNVKLLESQCVGYINI